MKTNNDKMIYCARYPKNYVKHEVDWNNEKLIITAAGRKQRLEALGSTI